METIYSKGMLFLLLITISVNTTGWAQSWILPDNRKNTRFTSDQFDIPRPALSLRSFDNTANDAYKHQYSATTYGVRQVLEKAYGINENQVSSVSTVFQLIVNESIKSLESFTNDDNRDKNSRILESRAFVALMSFIIEKILPFLIKNRTILIFLLMLLP